MDALLLKVVGFSGRLFSNYALKRLRRTSESFWHMNLDKFIKARIYLKARSLEVQKLLTFPILPFT